MKRVIRIFCFALFALAAAPGISQTTATFSIVEQDSLETAAPGSVRSPWRYSNDSTDLFRYVGSSWVPLFDTLYSRNDSLFYVKFGTEKFGALISASGGVSDGDKGDITVASSGTVWTIDNDAVDAAAIAADAVGSSEIATGAVDTDELAATAVTPGSYTSTNLTVDADGRITAASNGSGSASIFKEENSSTDATAGTTDNYHVGDLAIGDFSATTIAADFHIWRADQAVLRLSDDGTVDSTTLAFLEFYRGANTSKLGDFGFLDNTDQHIHLRNNMSGGGISFATGGSIEKSVLLASGQWHWNLYGDSSYIVSSPVHFLAVDDDGYVGEVNISETKNPSVTSPSVAGTTSIDLDSKDEGVFYIDLSSRVNTTLTLSNPWNGGRYSIWFEGVSNDTITFPDNFLSKDRDSLLNRVADTDEIMNFWYDGANFITPDTFWTGIGGAAPSFSPLDIASLVVWYDASQEAYSNGANVSTINDFSGNNLDATQGTAGNQATFATNVVNGEPVYRFDGSNDYYTRAALTQLNSGSDFTVFWVAAQHTEEQNGAVWSTADPNDTDDFRVVGLADTRAVNLNHSVLKTDDGAVATNKTSDASANVFYVYGFSCDFSTSGGTNKAYVSSSEVASQAWTYTTDSYTNAFFTLGIQHNLTVPLDGDIAAVLIFSEVLSSGDRASVINYLETKYGL